jgi:hypothetical protein
MSNTLIEPEREEVDSCGATPESCLDRVFTDGRIIPGSPRGPLRAIFISSATRPTSFGISTL